MSTHSNETPGHGDKQLVWSSERPLYPALEALATFDLANEAVREYQRMLNTGMNEHAARRVAAQVGDGLNPPKQPLPDGLGSVAVADEAIARYRDHQTRGLDHSTAATEAAIDTSTAHTEPINATGTEHTPGAADERAAPAPEQEPEPPRPAAEDAEVRVDAAMRRAENAVDRADTDLATRHPAPTQAVEPPGLEPDRGVGEVSL